MTNNILSFILDGERKEVDFTTSENYTTNTTLLQYLRSLDNHKGTKEGCAEGDCGACTVVLVDAKNSNQLNYKAVNSCLILLPQVQGKQVITVENLTNNNTLHPVQKAMVNHDASQCGFCTPGFVMSLFALYHSQPKASKEQIADALAGNLCRCTGYQSIIDAGIDAFTKVTPDSFSKQEKNIIQKLKSIPEQDNTYISGELLYFQPATLKSALTFKASNPKSLFVNGCTDVALRITKKKEILPLLLDLSMIKGFDQIKKADGHYELGAGLTLEQFKQTLGSVYPAMNKMLAVFGSKQIRQLGTLAGNIASASPIGDVPPVLMAYGAKLEIQSSQKKRIIELKNFIKGYRQTDLKQDELITNILLPFPDKDGVVDALKSSKRKDLDISTVCCAMALKTDENRKVKSIQLYYGGMAATTLRAAYTEKYLLHKKWDERTIHEAAELIEEDFKPISDARAQAEGRSQLAKNLLIKLWTLHE